MPERLHVLYAAVALVLLSMHVGFGAPITEGPKDDILPIGIQPQVVTLHSVHDFTLTLPVFGTIGFLYKDTQDVVVHKLVVITVKSYSTYEANNFNPDTSLFRLTEVMAQSLDAGLGTATGFDAAAPELQPLSPTVFQGRSGARYVADVNIATSMQNLVTLLPAFDLTPFQGDPSSLVYVSQATVPASDGVVPEPSSLLLLVPGLLAVVVYRYAATAVQRLASCLSGSWLPRWRSSLTWLFLSSLETTRRR